MKSVRVHSVLSRGVFSILAVVIISALMAACTSSVDTSPQEEQPAGAAVETKFGQVTVPENPERVVALGWGDAETALSLGVQPVGASDWLDFGGEGVGPWGEGLYDTPPEIIGTMEPDYEQIANLSPDLILDVRSSGDQARYDRLSQIAPTVGVPEGGDNYLTTLDQQVEMISTALGKSERGKQQLSELDAKFAQAREQHPEFADKSVAVSAFTSQGWGAYIETAARVQFMEQLGFRQSEQVAKLEPDGFSAPISQEQLGVLDADLLVVFPIYVPVTQVTDQAEFQRLNAVAEDRAIVFDDTKPEDQALSNAYSLYSVLSIPYAIDNMVPRAAEHIAS